MKNILPTYTILISRYMVKSILAIWAVATVISCGSKNETPASADSTHVENSVTLSAAQLKNSEIVLGKIEQKSISSVLKVNGRIDVPPQKYNFG
jgi:cobalt-zinc-cadmium efflux system membrane fusion protein